MIVRMIIDMEVLRTFFGWNEWFIGMMKPQG